MSTIIPFTPNNALSPPFQAQVTLDNKPYLLATMWNFYRAGWYVSITDQSGNVICNQALVGSPPGFDIQLFPGFFTTSTIVYRPSKQNFEQTP